LDEATKQRIADMVNGNKVFLFMKGTPDFPQCGFSMRAVSILRAMNVDFGAAPTDAAVADAPGEMPGAADAPGAGEPGGDTPAEEPPAAQ
jgi:hypothetical protein